MSSLGELRTIALSARRNGKRVKERAPDNRAAYLFLLPWLIGIVVFTIGPMLASLYLSFTDYNLLKSPLENPPDFIGLANYTEMLGDAAFWNSFRVTVTYVVVSVPLQLGLALGLALLLDRGLRGLSFYRSIFYLPSLLGGSVAVAILWRQVFGKEGLVNGFLALFGIDAPGWIGHPDYALGTIIILHIWTFGSPMVIFLAGLRQIPEMYHEAAAVDGAGRVRRFFSITLPLLTPIIAVVMTFSVLFTFTDFQLIWAMTRGGPVNATHLMATLSYQRGILSGTLGEGAAIATAMVPFLLGAIMISWFGLQRRAWQHGGSDS